MAVQVPTLQRAEPVAPISTGQISTQVVDEVRPAQQVSNAIESTAGKAIDLYQKAEDDYAHTKSTEIANAYNNWVTEKINGTKDSPGLRHLKGDPTEHYAQFEIEAAKKREELSAGEYSKPVKDQISKRLTDTEASLYNSRLVIQGNQNAEYEKEVSDSAIKLASKEAVDTISLMTTEDYAKENNALDVQLDKIKNEHIRYAGKVGLTAEDKPTKLAIAETQSDVVYNAINNLIAADELDNADALMKNYNSLLDPVNMQKITDKYNNAKFDQQMYTIAGELHGLDYKEQDAKINEIEDPKLKSKVRQLLRSEQAAIQQMKDIASKQNFNVLYEAITASKPVSTFVFEETQLYKDLAPTLSVEQKNALKEVIRYPKDSDSKALQDMQDFVAQNEGRDFKKLTASERAVRYKGLNGADRTHYDNLHERLNLEKADKPKENLGYVLEFVDKRIDNLWEELPPKFKNPKRKIEINGVKYDMNGAKALYKRELQNSFMGSGTFDQKAMEAAIQQSWVQKKKEVQKVEKTWYDDWFGSDDKDTVKPEPVAPVKFGDTKSTKTYTDDELIKMDEEYTAAHGGKYSPSIEETKKWYESKGK